MASPYEKFENVLKGFISLNLVTSVVKEKVSKICWKDTNKINLHLSLLPVILSQELGILYHNSLIQISLMCSRNKENERNEKVLLKLPHYDVKNVNKVRSIVKDKPSNWHLILKLPEY